MCNNKNKKFKFVIGLSLVTLFSTAISSCKKVPPLLKNNICMITDSGDITDESFNQNTWEGCIEFEKLCKDNGIDVHATYKKPYTSELASLVEAMELGIDQGAGTIVVPGFSFAKAIADVAPRYPEVKFISLDTDASSFGEKFVLPENVYSCTYQDELSGFMAGYAAACEGYHNFGFLGGLAVASVKRYGYGFCRGIDYYAQTLGTSSEKFYIRYAYGNQFFGDSDIKARMDTWYKAPENPSEVVFCCGGSIYTSACESALSAMTGDFLPKIIGVDVDQGPLINKKYHEHMCLTSATKGLKAAVIYKLFEYVIENKWESKYEKLSFSKDFLADKNPENNYIQLALSSFGKVDGLPKELEKFTYDNYVDLALEIYKANLKLDDANKELMEAIKVDISLDSPSILSSNVHLEDQGYIK